MIHHAIELQKQAHKRRLVGFSAMAAIGLMFAAIVVNSFWASAARRGAEALEVHSLDVLLVAGHLETTVNGAMRGERGFLITGDPGFLQPYDEGRARSLSLVRRLRALARDNPEQLRNLVLVENRLDTYLAVLGRVVALEESGRHGEAVATIRSGVDRRQIVALGAAIDRIEVVERRLLAMRAAASAAADARTDAYDYLIAAAGAVLMALLAAAILSAARAHRLSLGLTEELQRLASTDMLTGLPNRRQLMAAIETEVLRAGRSGRPLSLALLDIDHFKSVNDRHGHPAGDAVLQQVADVLREVTRGGDVLGRFGGEEFAILMPETTIEQALLAGERLRAAIARCIMAFPRSGSGRVTISTGVARLTDGEACDQLISRADAALYEAKAGGRNLVRLAA